MKTKTNTKCEYCEKEISHPWDVPSVFGTISYEVSDILHKYISDLDGTNPDELVECVLRSLSSFIGTKVEVVKREF